MPADLLDAAATESPASVRGRRRVRFALETRDRRRQWLIWGLSIILCTLLVNAIVGENGYLATLRARGEQAELEAAVARVRLDNQKLQRDSRRLLHDPSALEETARREMGFIRPGETLVIVRAPTPDSSSK